MPSADQEPIQGQCSHGVRMGLALWRSCESSKRGYGAAANRSGETAGGSCKLFLPWAPQTQRQQLWNKDPDLCLKAMS